MKGKYKCYVQLVFKGNPPVKTKKNGEPKHPEGYGDVGLDIGTQTIAISSRTDVKIHELADRIQPMENEKRRLHNIKEAGQTKTGQQSWQL